MNTTSATIPFSGRSVDATRKASFASRFQRWNSPAFATFLLVLIGIAMLALLLGLNAASPADRQIIHIGCCDDAPG
jgi:hypothetical protein